MAQIDVSFLLNDPDFVDSFCIIRRKAIVDDFGENKLVETSINAIGSIQAGNGDTLARLPEGAVLSNTKTVFTKTELIADTCGGYSDIIVWKNKRYQVLTVTDWDNYGEGWFRCDCVFEGKSL